MCRLLIVEPEPAQARTIRLALRVLQERCEGLIAPDGATGLRIARDEPVTAALIATQLPDTTLAELAAALRALRPGILIVELGYSARGTTQAANLHVNKLQLLDDLREVLDNLHPGERPPARGAG